MKVFKVQECREEKSEYIFAAELDEARGGVGMCDILIFKC